MVIHSIYFEYYASCINNYSLKYINISRFSCLVTIATNYNINIYCFFLPIHNKRIKSFQIKLFVFKWTKNYFGSVLLNYSFAHKNSIRWILIIFCGSFSALMNLLQSLTVFNITLNGNINFSIFCLCYYCNQSTHQPFKAVLHFD